MRRDKNREWRDKVQCHLLLSLPDGSSMGLWVRKDETIDEAINGFTDNWYKVTTEDPETFGHIVLKDKCPRCKERLHAKEYDNEIFCWCPSCRYEERRKGRDNLRCYS